MTEVDLPEAMARFRSSLKDTGFKTVAAFEKGSVAVGIEFDGLSYKVTQYQKDADGVNEPCSSKDLGLAPTAEEIGREVLLGLRSVR